jgi:hypothetical protein
MLRNAALIRNDVSENLINCVINGTRIGELGTTLAVTSYRSCCEEVLNLRSVIRLLVTANSPDDGSNTFYRNVESYKRLTA